ncbi:MAG: hypothetical protein QNK40_10570 [Desulfobacterales bacterium]|nr:hypothetical protein [Desulfobacterales bacterium]
MLPLSHNQIRAIRNEKRNLEVEVAKKLYGYFNAKYKYRIQKIVRILLNHILSARKQNDLNLILVGKKGKFLMFKQGVQASVHGLNQFLKREASWTLDQCSDMIRLFGEINEDWHKLGLSQNHEDGQKKLRPEPTFLKVGSGKPVKEGGWGKNFGHRHRGDKSVPQKTGEPFVNIGSIIRGIDKFQFLPKSVIAAIDRTFGLRPEGGDVSGTTTDSLYALRWGGGVSGLTQDMIKAIQILPLVTMVPQGHHTMVECAYPLSRHGVIDYHIGYYNTLAPKESPALFNTLLGPLDGSDKNKHILVWGHGSGEQGVQMDRQDEIAAFKKMARVLSAYGFCVTGGLSDFEQALNAVKTFSPAFLAPRLEQLRDQVGLSELERKFRQMRNRPR